MSNPVKYRPWGKNSLGLGLSFGDVFFKEERPLPDNFDPKKLELVSLCSLGEKESLKERIGSLKEFYIFPSISDLEGEIPAHEWQNLVYLKPEITEVIRILTDGGRIRTEVVLLGEVHKIRCRKSERSKKLVNIGLAAIQFREGGIEPPWPFQWGYRLAHISNPIVASGDAKNAFVLVYPVE
ncbi:MAG TPA: hypothetical protein P5056_01910 [Candidatus Paceibacterota bacterium]|nr:hypothetical protein [Candidatus Paceibacterota bacterium]